MKRELKCIAGDYKDNSVVIMSAPIVCYGFKGQSSPCKYLEKCLNTWGVKLSKNGRRIKMKGWKDKIKENLNQKGLMR